MAQPEQAESVDQLRMFSLTRGVLLDNDALASIVTLKARLRSEQSELLVALESGALTDDEYLDGLERILKNYMESVRSIVGSDSYAALFDTAETDPWFLVDRETYMLERYK